MAPATDILLSDRRDIHASAPRHRLGTELDLGPNGAYPWLLANGGRFHFVRRYPCE